MQSDPIAAGLERGWRVYGGPHAVRPRAMTCDVAIVGSGAGAGITAELLTKAGLDVVIIEEGPLLSSRHFQQLESQAYPTLYQESAARKTADKAINILQGRCVGGSTTVNWTSSFRTPPATLRWWVEALGLEDYSPQALAPWFEQAEARLSIAPWPVAPNTNNELLRQGALRLGIEAQTIQRNVKGCWNLGSCGLGCPTNAKQSMLVTTLPAALDAGARLLVETRVERLQTARGRVTGLIAHGVRADGSRAPDAVVHVQAKHTVVAAGAINSPALLLRSGAPDPFSTLGRRTFLHPVVISSAVFEHPVLGWEGAPQTIYTDHFLEQHPMDGPIGYKIEAPPVHPVIFSTTSTGFGSELAADLRAMHRTHALLALLRDGFNREAPGGQVRLKPNGSPLLDYPLNDYLFDGMRRAFMSMAELQFAAGAQRVRLAHDAAGPLLSWREARQAIPLLPMKPLLVRVASAHVMGGCAMAAEPSQGVVQPDGRHWQLESLSVLDGSLFPTSLGANPQLSIYGIVKRLASQLARELTGRTVKLS